MQKSNRWWAVFLGIALAEVILLIKLFIMSESITSLLVAISILAVLLMLTLRIDDLVKVQVGKEGMNVELEEKVERVEKEQDKISDIQRQQQEEIKHIAGFLVNNLLGRHEKGLLKVIASDKPFPYEQKTGFDESLKKLRKLGLITCPAGKQLNVSCIPDQSDNLNDFVNISERGKMCLKFLSFLNQSSDND